MRPFRRRRGGRRAHPERHRNLRCVVRPSRPSPADRGDHDGARCERRHGSGSLRLVLLGRRGKASWIGRLTLRQRVRSAGLWSASGAPAGLALMSIRSIAVSATLWTISLTTVAAAAAAAALAAHYRPIQGVTLERGGGSADRWCQSTRGL